MNTLTWYAHFTPIMSYLDNKKLGYTGNTGFTGCSESRLCSIPASISLGYCLDAFAMTIGVVV